MKQKLALFILPALLLAAFIILPAYAQSTGQPTDIMLRANQLYEAGQFADAATLYRKLLNQGFEDSRIYYNLGNARFKQGDLGRAILNYRQAQNLAPRDTDIQTNLALARSETLDSLSGNSPTLISRLVEFGRTWLTLNEMAILALTQWGALAGLIILYTWLKPGRLKILVQYATLLLGILLLIGLFSMGSRLYLENNRPPAVIVAPAVNVTSGPGDHYMTEFTLHSGTEVNLLEQRDHWARLTLPGNRLQGWIPAETVETVSPDF